MRFNQSILSYLTVCQRWLCTTRSGRVGDPKPSRRGLRGGPELLVISSDRWLSRSRARANERYRVIAWGIVGVETTLAERKRRKTTHRELLKNSARKGRRR